MPSLKRTHRNRLFPFPAFLLLSLFAPLQVLAAPHTPTLTLTALENPSVYTGTASHFFNTTFSSPGGIGATPGGLFLMFDGFDVASSQFAAASNFFQAGPVVPGVYNAQLEFTGSPLNNPVTTAGFPYTIVAATSLSMGGFSPLNYGDFLNHTANVTRQILLTAPNGGSVSFFMDSQFIGMGSAGSGGTWFPPSVRPLPGNHSIAATYNGSQLDLPSSNARNFIVNKVTSNLQAAVLGGFQVYGTPVTLRATVPNTFSGLPNPSGSVGFYRGSVSPGNLLANVPFLAERAELVTTSLSSGTQTIVMSYAGDSNYNATSGSVNFTLQRGTVNMQFVGYTPGTPQYGQAVTARTNSFYSTPQGSYAHPTGTVSVVEGASVLQSITFQGLVQQNLPLPILSTGNHPVMSVRYSGDANYLPVTVAVSSLFIQAASTQTDLAVSPDPSSNEGDPVVLSMTLDPFPGPGGPAGPVSPATGPVSFFDNLTLLGIVPLASDSAALTVTGLAPGSHPLRARYGGDTNYGFSLSPIRNHSVVAPPTPTVTDTPMDTPTQTSTPTESPTFTPTGSHTWTSTETSTPTATVSPTQTSTLEPTATLTQTRTMSPTLTLTDTPTVTATPSLTPPCGSPQVFGQVSSFSTELLYEVVYCSAYTVSNQRTVYRLSAFTWGGSNQLNLGIYADSGVGTPGALITQATPRDCPAGWHDFDIYPVVLEPGTYWLGVKTGNYSPGAGTIGLSAAPGVPRASISQSFGNGDFPTGPQPWYTENPWVLTVYASYCDGSGYVPTLTPTATLTGTATPSPTASATASSTPSSSFTPSWTPSLTVTETSTGTQTPTDSTTPTPTSSATLTATPTSTDTPTATETATASGTPSPTPSLTGTETSSATATQTPTETATASLTATPLDTLTGTPSQTSTATATATSTSTDPMTPTASFTATLSPTATLTASGTATLSPSATASQTSTSTYTLTGTLTASSTPSPSFTMTQTSTVPATETPTVTPSPTASVSPTRTATSAGGPITAFPNYVGPGVDQVVFTVPGGTRVDVTIYTLAGGKVIRLQGSSGTAVWNLGRKVASGLYLALVESRDGSGVMRRKIVKVTVKR